MSMRELDRLKAIQAVLDGRLARWRAAERLGISAWIASSRMSGLPTNILAGALTHQNCNPC
ncbi:hypothetical protein [Cupriavidus sp. YAF13]|uniref:hypothetical protein n=1 Tax=Cupriavidus sp. YAF13 TaxID=3233075 RepID=UPI003F929750